MFLGVWEVWNTIVYPRKPETPHRAKFAPFRMFAQRVQGLSGEDTISRQNTDDPINQDLADEQCLYIYLSHHHDILVQCEVSSHTGVSQMVSTVHRIFEQLHNRQVALLSTSTDQTTDTPKLCNSQRLPMVMAT